MFKQTSFLMTMLGLVTIFVILWDEKFMFLSHTFVVISKNPTVPSEATTINPSSSKSDSVNKTSRSNQKPSISRKPSRWQAKSKNKQSMNQKNTRFLSQVKSCLATYNATTSLASIKHSIATYSDQTIEYKRELAEHLWSNQQGSLYLIHNRKAGGTTHV